MGGEITTILERLERIERLLLDQKTVKDWYSTDEAATLLGKAEFTVREWCRLHRVNAEKRRSGRGKHCAWVISRQELIRFQRDGLLPIKN